MVGTWGNQLVVMLLEVGDRGGRYQQEMIRYDTENLHGILI